MKTFFLVPARDKNNVHSKIKELEELGVNFLVICGEEMDHERVIYREARGKWDAINYGIDFVPEEVDVVVFNDVDTKIYNLEKALDWVERGKDLVYCKIVVEKGPQVKFYKIENLVRERLHIACQGELLLVKKKVLEDLVPVPPCLAEDSYLLFKALEKNYSAKFCTEAFTVTERTSELEEEMEHKTRTTLGIYQALRNTNPSVLIKAFYKLLPFIAPFFALAGEDGRAWATGILRAWKLEREGVNIAKF